MEFINRVEIQGIVGSVRDMAIADTHCYRFSAVTEIAYTGRDGSSVIDCTWHNITAFTPRGVAWDWLAKGAVVHVQGRLRASKYVSASGEESRVVEILADSVEKVEG